MLEELSVKGFGIIESVAWRPGAGFNVITGETGAGKSLVVDAVEALLSGQVKEEDIRHGTDAAQVEGILFLPSANRAGSGDRAGKENPAGYESLMTLLEEKGLEAEDGRLVLSCDFRRQGRTVPRVNRQAVSRAVMQEIGGALVDIHGQSEHLSLLKREHHLDFLDAYAHTLGPRGDFNEKVTALHQLEKELAALSRNDRDTARQLELLDFQIEEISRAELREGEEEELRDEMTLLAAAEKLKAAAYEIYKALTGGDGFSEGGSATDILNAALPQLRNIADTDATLRPQLSSYEDALLGLEELARDIRSYADNLNDDPARLEEVQGRLELIRGLKRKYGDSIAEILAYAENALKEREGLTDSGARREQLAGEIDERKRAMGKLGKALSGKRQEAAASLSEAVKRELADLGMGRVEFSVTVAQRADESGLPCPDGETVAYDGTGIDEVAFLASTNPGEPPKPLEKIASTGEISRFLLALKSALAEADTTPVLIFDEIDIGVGGRSGEVIGRKLWNLSRHHQVICVTHLPQIAAFADAQFTVSKLQKGDRTVSTIEPLEGAARTQELALMLAGKPTETALKTARELIEKAAAWKTSA